MEQQQQHAWENHKENFQAREGGYRKEHVVKAALGGKSFADLKAQHDRYEEQTTKSGGMDPIQCWVDYLEWIEREATPQDYKVDRGKVLEGCVLKFREDPQYRNDIRYVALCAKYAELCSEPLEVFRYMDGWAIGTKLAYFYKTWALALERLGRYTEAQETMEMGLHRPLEAGEIESLRFDYDNFMQRYALHQKRAASEPPEDDGHADPKRQALTGMRALPGGAAPSNRAPSESGPRGGLGPSRAAASSSTGSNRGFAIFSDSSDAASTASRAAPHSMPSESLLTKENAQTAGKWTTNKLGGSAPALAPLPVVPVFQDPECAAPAPIQAAPPMRAPSERPALAVAKPVQRVELKNFAKERGQSRNTDQGYLGYDPVPIYGGDVEMSFEEVRMARWLARPTSPKRQTTTAVAPPALAAKPSAILSSAPGTMGPPPSTSTSMSAAVSAPPAAAPPALRQALTSRPSVSPEISSTLTAASATTAPGLKSANPTAPAPASILTARAPASPPHPPSPTITTKMAMQDVYAMFGPSSDFAPLPPASVSTTASSSAPFGLRAAPSGAVGLASSAPALAAGAKFAFFCDDDGVRDENAENIPPSAAARPVAAPAALSATGLGARRPALQSVAPAAMVTEEEEEEMTENMRQLQQRSEAQLAADPRHNFQVYEDNTETVTTMPGHVANVSSFSTFGDATFAHSTPFAKQGAFRDLSSAPASVVAASVPRSSLTSSAVPLPPSSSSAPSVPLSTATTPAAFSFGAPSSAAGLPLRSAAPAAGHQHHHLSPIMELSHETSSLSSNKSSSDTTLKHSVYMPSTHAVHSHASIAEHGEDVATVRRQLQGLSGFSIHPGSCPVLNPGSSITLPLALNCSISPASITIQKTLGADDQVAAVLDDSKTPLMLEKFALLSEAATCYTNGKRLSERIASLPEQQRMCIARPLGFVSFDDCALLASDARPVTLHDILQHHNSAGKFMDEPLLMFLAIELLRAVETMHSAGTAHGMLTLQNVRLRCGGGVEDLSELFDPTGNGGWSEYGLQLSGFAHCSELMAPAGVRAAVLPDSVIGALESVLVPLPACKLDHLMLLDILHQFLQRDRLALATDDDGDAPSASSTKLQLANPLARYWQAHVWTKIFNGLLSMGTGSGASASTAVSALVAARKELQVYLAQNPTRTRLLRLALGRLENDMDMC